MDKKEIERIKIADAGGDTLTVSRRENGMLLPVIFDVLDFDALKTLKLRDDDILLLSYARSGCNWLWEQTKMIVTGSTDGGGMVKQAGMFEMNATEKLDLLPSPRILNTHLYYHHLPEDIKKKKTKLVFIYRNPRDVAVSFYHLHSGSPWWEYSGKFENWLGLFCDGTVDGGGYAEYLNHWASVIKENPDLPVHVLTYEGLQKNPIEELSRLCRFLGQERDVSFLQAVTEACSIGMMRDRSGPFWEKLGFKDGPNLMHRKGTVGDWKNHFTVAMSEQFDQFWSKAFKASDIFPIPV